MDVTQPLDAAFHAGSIKVGGLLLWHSMAPSLVQQDCHEQFQGRCGSESRHAAWSCLHATSRTYNWSWPVFLELTMPSIWVHIV